MKVKVFFISLFISLLCHGALFVTPWNLISKKAKIEVSSGKSGFKVQLNNIKKKPKLKKTRARKKVVSSKSSKIIRTKDLGGTTSSKLLNRNIPKYPYKSRIFVEEGMVKIKINLDSKGVVTDAVVLLSSNYERLDLAALEAARGSSFLPEKKLGQNVPSVHVLDFKFELNE